jgi:hypothetical protein
MPSTGGSTNWRRATTSLRATSSSLVYRARRETGPAADGRRAESPYRTPGRSAGPSLRAHESDIQGGYGNESGC